MKIGEIKNCFCGGKIKFEQRFPLMGKDKWITVWGCSCGDLCIEEVYNFHFLQDVNFIRYNFGDEVARIHTNNSNLYLLVIEGVTVYSQEFDNMLDAWNMIVKYIRYRELG